MTIDITQLNKSFNKIKTVGTSELSFEVDGMQVTLQTLPSSREHEVEDWAAEILREAEEDDLKEEDAPTFNLWFDRTRIGALAQSIVRFDGHDLSESDYIKTGVDAKGEDVLKPRFVVMREIVAKWSRPLLQLMFTKYGDLMNVSQNKLFGAIHIEPSNLDSEIDRLHVRLRELEELKRKQAKAASEETDSVVRAQKVVEHGRVRTEVHEELAHTSVLAQAQGSDQDPRPSDTHAQMGTVRRAYMPETAPPPVPLPEQPAPQPPAPVQAAPQPVATAPQPIPAARAPRTLRQAAEVAQGPTPVVSEVPGTVQGLPVYGSGPSILEHEPTRAGSSVPLDQVPQGARNPRFKAPK